MYIKVCICYVPCLVLYICTRTGYCICVLHVLLCTWLFVMYIKYHYVACLVLYIYTRIGYRIFVLHVLLCIWLVVVYIKVCICYVPCSVPYICTKTGWRVCALQVLLCTLIVQYRMLYISRLVGAYVGCSAYIRMIVVGITILL